MHSPPRSSQISFRDTDETAAVIEATARAYGIGVPEFCRVAVRVLMRHHALRLLGDPEVREAHGDRVPDLERELSDSLNRLLDTTFTRPVVPGLPSMGDPAFN